MERRIFFAAWFCSQPGSFLDGCCVRGPTVAPFAAINDKRPVDYPHSIRRAEVDRRCVWVLKREGSLDGLRTVPRAMRVEHLEAKCSGCRGGE